MPPVGFEPMISGGERPQAARLLRSWVRIPPGAWIFVCCECRVLSGRSLCNELITRPEESYQLWCVVCDLETSRIGAPYIYDISSLRVKSHSNPQQLAVPLATTLPKNSDICICGSYQATPNLPHVKLFYILQLKRLSRCYQ
jgi:hypothetical protein